MPEPVVLLVDDDPAVRSSIAFALEIEGFAVAAFESAEALFKVEQAPQHACIVLDHRLPGVDGLALLAALRARGDAAPAIIITSNPVAAVRNIASGEGSAK
jgi:FixJ family two-component response regulator